MRKTRFCWTGVLMAFVLVGVLPRPAMAEQPHEVDAIYRLFLAPEIDLDAVKAAYADDVIHVGPPGEALISGRERFLEENILPLTSVINTGRANLEGRFHIVRRVVSEDLVHDVGYFHSDLQVEGRTSIEQLQKFSWVFRKASGGTWQVITDFDATPADLEILPEIVAVRVIE